jgi:hypothetical protein
MVASSQIDLRRMNVHFSILPLAAGFRNRGKMRRISIITTVLLICACSPADGQPGRKSQLATVTQVVGPARIEIRYRRPVARGRELFGGIVRWDHEWTPSADTAAIFTTTTALDVAGSRLPAGRYSIWMIPNRPMWTIIFTSEVPVFHIPYRPGHEVVRVRVLPSTGDHMETLGFYFPMVDADSAVLNMHWGKTIVPIPMRAR